jgi:hypothetical protein
LGILLCQHETPHPCTASSLQVPCICWVTAVIWVGTTSTLAAKQPSHPPGCCASHLHRLECCRRRLAARSAASTAIMGRPGGACGR